MTAAEVNHHWLVFDTICDVCSNVPCCFSEQVQTENTKQHGETFTGWSWSCRTLLLLCSTSNTWTYMKTGITGSHWKVFANSFYIVDCVRLWRETLNISIKHAQTSQAATLQKRNSKVTFHKIIKGNLTQESTHPLQKHVFLCFIIYKESYSHHGNKLWFHLFSRRYNLCLKMRRNRNKYEFCCFFTSGCYKVDTKQHRCL